MHSARHRQRQNSERGGYIASGDFGRKSAWGSPAESGRASCIYNQNTGNVTFYVTLLISLMCFGVWGTYRLCQDIQDIHRKHGDVSQQTQSLTKSMDVVLKQLIPKISSLTWFTTIVPLVLVLTMTGMKDAREHYGQSFQLAIEHIEAILKETMEKQEQTDATARHASMEVKRINDILNKMQNEILKDLSDGIQDVKNSRERDVPFFEKSVEEKLTDLTSSINDNIATFTKIQRTSQEEISDIKKRVVFLEETTALRVQLEIIKNTVTNLEVTMKSDKYTFEMLKRTVESVETSLSEEVQALGSLKQEQDIFNEALRTENSEIQALQSRVLEVEKISVHLPEDLVRVNADLHNLKEVISSQQNLQLSEKQALLEIHNKTSRVFESRFQGTEENIESLISLIAQQSEKLDSFRIGQDDLQRRLKVLDSLEQETVSDSSSLTEQVSHFASSQESLANDFEELKQHIHSKDATFQTFQDELNGLQDHQHSQNLEFQSKVTEISDGLELLHNTMMPKDVLEKLTDVQETVNGLTSSLDQINNDVKSLSPTVEELVTVSGQVKENKNNLLSMEGTIKELQKNFDRILEKIELIQESI